MISPFQLFIDEKTRKDTFPNITRYMTLNLSMFHLSKSFGKISFCKKIINPNYEIKIEKKKEEPKKQEGGGKDGGKGGKDAGGE